MNNKSYRKFTFFKSNYNLKITPYRNKLPSYMIQFKCYLQLAISMVHTWLSRGYFDKSIMHEKINFNLNQKDR